MCGFAGMVGPGADVSTVRKMMAALKHRGPDDDGLWQSAGVCLGHQRLSIIDLKTGHQPIRNEDRTIWIVFNGEIYNFRELRNELEAKGHRFYTRTDTEVIIHLYEESGPSSFIRLNGIFVFALWDERQRCALLVRDRFGVKPLHYYWNGETLRFSSEIKGLLSDPSLPRQLNPQALHDFLNLRYIPGEQTLFTNIFRLAPAHFLKWCDGKISLNRYWALSAEEKHDVSPDAWAETIRDLLSQAVRRQLVSDVPLGIYLSGGLDSSSLVAAATKCLNTSVQTFTLGFNEPTDEIGDARMVAEHFHTDHHEMTLNADPLHYLPEVIWHVEEPKVNILQGYLLSRFARSRVKVILNGLGGDELFAGYDIHRYIGALQGLHRWIPGFIARGPLEWISRAAYSLQDTNDAFRWHEHRLGIQWISSLGRPARHYALLRNAWDYNPGISERIYGPALRELAMRPVETCFEPYFQNNGRTTLTQVLRAEFETKMVNDFLLGEDRVSMAHGLEVRVPYLDHELVNLAWQIPATLKLHWGHGKFIFKKAVDSWLPKPIMQKKKWGFTFSSYHQYQKDLKIVAEAILTPERVRDAGWFNYSWIRAVLDYPPHFRLRWHYFMLWMMVGFEIWRQMFLSSPRVEPSKALQEYYG
jgi:asparagine synthase (glutamine-hydrolysing)